MNDFIRKIQRNSSDKMAFKLNIAIVIFTFLISLTFKIEARPGLREEYGQFEDKCKIGVDEVLETCQRCAKQTKSPIVYPMCCANEDDAYNWCSKFINFGEIYST